MLVQSSCDDEDEVNSCVEIMRPANPNRLMDSRRDDTRTPTPDPDDYGSENGFGSHDGDRESRSYSRDSAWKRRDQSWDKKWKEQVKILVSEILVTLKNLRRK